MLGLKMDKLALDHADRRVDSTISNSRRNEGQVRILNVEYGAARELCQQMNIARLPTIHMYMPSSSSSRSIQTTSDDRESTTTTSSNVIGRMTKVQDFSCSLKDFQRVKDLTAGYILVQQQQQQETPPMAATRIQSKSRPLEHNLRSTTTSTTPLDEEFFEATLDAGRNLIQSQLLLAALDRKKNKPPVVDPITGGIIREPSSSSSSSFSLAASSTSWRYHSTKIVEDGNDSAAVKTKRGFWSRFRKQA